MTEKSEKARAGERRRQAAWRERRRAAGGDEVLLTLNAAEAAAIRARAPGARSLTEACRRALVEGAGPAPADARPAALAALVATWRGKLAGRDGPRVKEAWAMLADLEVLVGEAADRP